MRFFAVKVGCKTQWWRYWWWKKKWNRRREEDKVLMYESDSLMKSTWQFTHQLLSALAKCRQHRWWQREMRIWETGVDFVWPLGSSLQLERIIKFALESQNNHTDRTKIAYKKMTLISLTLIESIIVAQRLRPEQKRHYRRSLIAPPPSGIKLNEYQCSCRASEAVHLTWPRRSVSPSWQPRPINFQLQINFGWAVMLLCPTWPAWSSDQEHLLEDHHLMAINVSRKDQSASCYFWKVTQPYIPFNTTLFAVTHHSNRRTWSCRSSETVIAVKWKNEQNTKMM